MSDAGPPFRPNPLNPAGSPAPDFSRKGDIDLRLAVRAFVFAAVTQSRASALDAAAVEVCTVAHRDGVRIERVLIVLNAEWDAADKPRALRSSAGEALRARLVSQCIRHFYGTQS